MRAAIKYYRSLNSPTLARDDIPEEQKQNKFVIQVCFLDKTYYRSNIIIQQTAKIPCIQYMHNRYPAEYVVCHIWKCTLELKTSSALLSFRNWISIILLCDSVTIF